MDTTKILPNIGARVSSPAFDASKIAEMSVGETAYAAAVFLSALAQRMADPATLGEFAQFSTAPGADWSGFQPEHSTVQAETPVTPPGDNAEVNEASGNTDESTVDDTSPLRPVAPENYYDSVPGIDRKSTRLNSSHVAISYAVFCLKKK